jgi:molybdopterin-guanine dinucleotide biosynthesis protein A
LILEFKAPVTCFVNASGFVEPLIGIWCPEALERLGENVRDGRKGLDAVVEELGGKLVRPLREEWIVGVDTKEI